MTLILIALALLITLSGPAVLAQPARPFDLPVTSPAGPGTWLLGQPYGNTIGAFLQGRNWYEAGQR